MVVVSGWVDGGSDHTRLVERGHDILQHSILSTQTHETPPAADMSSPPMNGDQLTFNYPKATLLCRPNSHPFQERNLNLSQAVKIGRSVARDRVMVTNAIFECKVLSRNHALLWYENGKFFLQDTKSSNGTFVNNQRLSLGGMESQPHELCSGDVVQFGVDVIENTRKVTHGCIVATLKLYLPDGKEAKASQISCIGNQGLGSVSAMELYQLNQYIQEATQREQQLEGKLGHLQRIVESTKSSAQQAWHCLLQEDLLLTRIDVLESQLQVFSNNAGEDKLRADMVSLLSEKLSYQQAAKESLRRCVEEKLAVAQRNAALEAALCAVEEERDNAQRLLDANREELQEIASQLINAQSKLRELSSQSEEMEQLQTQHEVLKVQVSECRHNETICQANYLCSQAKLAMLEAAMKLAKSGSRNNVAKDTKSESNILDNDNYQVINEGLLLKIDLHIDHLQRRLMEMTSGNNESTNEITKKNISDYTEETNDNSSDITVIENDSTCRLNQNNSNDTNNRNSVENTVIPSSLDIFKSNFNNSLSGLDDSNTSMQESKNDNSHQTKTIEQISMSLLELKRHREMLCSQQDNNETYTTTELIEEPPVEENNHVQNINKIDQQQQNLELQTDNERLRELVQSSQQQIKFYEQELSEVNQKIETLGIELQTRPSYNSLQEKENVCINQQITIDDLLKEQDILKKEMSKCKSTENDLQSRVSDLDSSIQELENTITCLQTALLAKDQRIDELNLELSTKTVEKIINEDTSVQTEIVPELEAAESTTQTPRQEYADFENSIQKDFEFLNDPTNELQEELVVLKEKFAHSSQENLRLTSNLDKLQSDYDNAMKQSRTMIFVYIAPLLALMLYVLLSPYMNPSGQ